MKQYDIEKENQLLRRLVLLCIKRSMRPSMKENAEMWQLLNELHLMTDKDEYKL